MQPTNNTSSGMNIAGILNKSQNLAAARHAQRGKNRLSSTAQKALSPLDQAHRTITPNVVCISVEKGSDEKGSDVQTLYEQIGDILKKTNVIDLTSSSATESVVFQEIANAIIAQDNEFVSQLLSHSSIDLDMEIEARSPYGPSITLLQIAISCGNTSAVELFLKRGASPTKVDAEQKSPLYCAVKGGHVAIVEHLFAHGAAIRTDEDHALLHLICTCGGDKATAVIDLLLQNGCNINALKGNKTALQLMCQLNKTDMIQYLMEKGASIAIFTDFILSPQHLQDTSFEILLKKVMDKTTFSILRPMLPQTGENIAVLEDTCRSFMTIGKSGYLQAIALALLYGQKKILLSLFQFSTRCGESHLWQKTLKNIRKHYGSYNCDFIESSVASLSTFFGHTSSCSVDSAAVQGKITVHLDRLSDAMDRIKSLKQTHSMASDRSIYSDKVLDHVHLLWVQNKKVKAQASAQEFILRIEAQEQLHHQKAEIIEQQKLFIPSMQKVLTEEEEAVKELELQLAQRQKKLVQEQKIYEQKLKSIQEQHKKQLKQYSAWENKFDRHQLLLEQRQQQMQQAALHIEEKEYAAQKQKAKEQEQLKMLLERHFDLFKSLAMQPSVRGLLFQNLLNDQECPLSLEPMKQPVIIRSGRTHERDLIAKWFNTKQTDPFTGASIAPDMIPNILLEKAQKTLTLLQEVMPFPVILWHAKEDLVMRGLAHELRRSLSIMQKNTHHTLEQLVAEDVILQKQEREVRLNIVTEAPQIIEHSLQMLITSLHAPVDRFSAYALGRAWPIRSALLLEQACKLCLALKPWPSPDAKENKHILLYSFRPGQLPLYRSHRVSNLIKSLEDKINLGKIDRRSLKISNLIRNDSFYFSKKNITSQWFFQLHKACLHEDFSKLVQPLLEEGFNIAISNISLASQVLRSCI